MPRIMYVYIDTQHDAQTDESVITIKWTADIQVQYLDCDEIDPIFSTIVCG